LKTFPDSPKSLDLLIPRVHSIFRDVLKDESSSLFYGKAVNVLDCPKPMSRQWKVPMMLLDREKGERIITLPKALMIQ
jgi:hypothetical protein